TLVSKKTFMSHGERVRPRGQWRLGQCPSPGPIGALPLPRAATRLPLLAPDDPPAANGLPPAIAECDREFHAQLRSRQPLKLDAGSWTHRRTMANFILPAWNDT